MGARLLCAPLRPMCESPRRNNKKQSRHQSRCIASPRTRGVVQVHLPCPRVWRPTTLPSPAPPARQHESRTQALSPRGGGRTPTRAPVPPPPRQGEEGACGWGRWHTATLLQNPQRDHTTRTAPPRRARRRSADLAVDNLHSDGQRGRVTIRRGGTAQAGWCGHHPRAAATARAHAAPDRVAGARPIKGNRTPRRLRRAVATRRAPTGHPRIARPLRPQHNVGRRPMRGRPVEHGRRNAGLTVCETAADQRMCVALHRHARAAKRDTKARR